jgi:Domain of unknown function (DUF4926)
MLMTFNEYDYVELTETLEPSLQRGTRGAIMMIYDISPPEYEVEFVDQDGQTIALRTVKGSQLRPVETTPVASKE